MKKRESKIVLLFCFAFLIILRVLLDRNEHLEIINAVINLIAFYIVVFNISEAIKEKTLARIARVCGAKEISKREQKKYTHLFYWTLIVINLLVSIIYIFFLRSNLGNDILSIISLALSLLDEEVVKIGSLLYKI